MMDKEHNKNKYNAGDKVFAKIWPAKITNIDSSRKLKKYTVTFYGTKEVNVVKEVELCSYAEKIALWKPQERNLKFNLSKREAEKSLNSSFNNQTNIRTPSGTSFIPLTDPSMSSSDLPSVTSTPFNTTSKPDVEPLVTNQLQPHTMPDRTAISLQILGNGWLTDESVDFYY